MSGQTVGGIMGYSPQAMLINQIKCTAITIVIFIVLMWILGKIPVAGPYVRDGISWVITKVSVYAGIANCGFTNK